MNPSALFRKTYKLMNVVTSVITILLLICFVFFFDSESGYFSNGVMTTIFFIAYAIGAAIAFSSILIPSEFEAITTDNLVNKKSSSLYIASGIGAIIIGIFTSTLALIAFGVYIILLTTKKGYEFSILKAILLFATIYLPTTLVLENGQNYYHHINSIENYLCVLFACSFLAYILQSAKRLCRSEHSDWHFPTMLLTYMSGLSLSSAYMIAFLFGCATEDQRFYQMLIILIISIFVGVELNRFTSALDSKQEIQNN